MSEEIERKFLVDLAKWEQVIKPEPTFYRQAYLALQNKATVRVRVSSEKAFITIKSADMQLSRTEYEYPIPLQDGLEMIATLTEGLIEKFRYKILCGEKLWEVDEFAGDNAGLIIAEIELTEESEAIRKPDWVGEEVTGDKRFYNSFLSRHPFKFWKEDGQRGAQ